MCLIHFSLNLSRTKAVHYSFLTWIRKYHHHKYCWIFQSTYFLSLYIVLVTPPVDKNKNYFQLVFLWGVLTEEWGDDQSYIILPTKRFYVAVRKFRNRLQITPKYCKNKKVEQKVQPSGSDVLTTIWCLLWLKLNRSTATLNPFVSYNKEVRNC